MAATNKARVKAVRQEETRLQLEAQNHIVKVIENIEKMEALSVKADGGDNGDEINYKDLQLNQFELNKLDKANANRLKLINKYLPDLKSTEFLGSLGIKEVKVFSDMYND